MMIHRTNEYHLNYVHLRSEVLLLLILEQLKSLLNHHEHLRLQLICSTLSEILPIVDNFERARQQLDPQGEEAQERAAQEGEVRGPYRDISGY